MRRPAPPAGAVPAEVLYFVPEPTIVLLGCRPLVPSPPERGPCRVCGGSVRDAATGAAAYCGQCDRMDPRHDANLARQRVEAEVTLKARDREAAAALALEHAKGKARGVELSEAHRRRIWMGYRKGNPLASEAEPSSLAVAGRKWLEEIGQLPDWSLILDARGRVVGRYQDDQAGVGASGAA